MSSSERLLDHLEESLSPTDIVLRELQRMARFRSTAEYLASRKPPAPPLNRMTKQARRAVENSMKGMPSDAIESCVREAVRDVLFLWHAHLKLNDRIEQGLVMAELSINLLNSELRRLLVHYELAGATNWFAYPLDPHTAAAVEAAVANQVRSWVSLSDPRTFREWAFQERQPKEDDDKSRATASRTLERELKRLVRSKDISAGRLVSLAALPIPFLRNAPLIEGRWIDAAVLELAEFGAILKDRGWTPRPTDDSHPLAFQDFVRAGAIARRSPIDDASWHDARQAATVRVRSYRGRRRVILRRSYVELSLYQRWRARTLDARLAASTEHGFVVSSWNDWLKGQGGDVALAGCWVEPIKPLEDPEVWSVHDSRMARRLQTYRTMLLGDLRFLALDGSESDAAEEARSRWRRLAEDAVTIVEGVAAAAESISAAHFRGHELVLAEYSGHLDLCRTKLRKLVGSFDTLSDKRDPLQAYFDDRSCPQDRESAYSPDEREAIERIAKRVVQHGERTARQIVVQARSEALESVGDTDAARTLAAQMLAEFLSE